MITTIRIIRIEIDTIIIIDTIQTTLIIKIITKFTIKSRIIISISKIIIINKVSKTTIIIIIKESKTTKITINNLSTNNNNIINSTISNSNRKDIKFNNNSNISLKFSLR